MFAIPLTLILLPGLSAPDWTTRERTESSLRGAPWATLDWAYRSAECPEARLRLNALRNRATIREIDRIAGGRFPEADDLWPCVASDEYKVLTLLYVHPPEFYRAPWSGFDQTDGVTWSEWRAKTQKHRTKAALIAYAGRTGDWDTVRRILK